MRVNKNNENKNGKTDVKNEKFRIHTHPFASASDYFNDHFVQKISENWVF
jgi:hypothetical protein